MSVLKIIFLIVGFSTVIFFIAAGYLGDGLTSIQFLMGESYRNMYGEMPIEIAAYFLLAVITLLSYIIIL